MRVLFVSQTYQPFVAHGGRPVKVHAMASGLAARGHDVTVVTADLGLDDHVSGPGWSRGKWGHEHRCDGVRAIYLPHLLRYHTATLSPRVATYAWSALTAARAPDVMHVFGMYDFLGPPLALWGHKRGVPHVVEPMGMYPPIIRNIPLKRAFLRLGGRAMLDTARRIIATSERERDMVQRAGSFADRVMLRRNGVVVPEEVPAAGELAERVPEVKGKSVLLFLGRLAAVKGLDLLLDAFAVARERVPDGESWRLVLAGPKKDAAFVTRLEQQQAKLGLGESIVWAGPLYDDDKWRAYRDAELLVVSSQNESFGNTIAEATLVGTPSIITEGCGIAPLVRGRCSRVVPYDVTAYADALSELMARPDLRDELRARCPEAAADLGWAQPLDETESLYRELCS